MGIVTEVKKAVVKRKGSPSTVGRLSDVHDAGVTDWIPSGFESVDAILGGGWPEGRASEVFGPEASGKSALLRAGCRGAQSRGGFGIILDYERTMDPDKFPDEGIDPTRIVYCRPDTIEDGLNILRDHFDQFEKKPPKFPVFIGYDTIAAAVASAELDEDDANDSHVGLQARAMGKMFRTLIGRLAKRRIHMMFVNQERVKIGGFSKGGFVPLDTPGGRAAKFYSSVRVRTTRIQTLGKGIFKTGYRMQAQTVKNKSFPPHRRASWVIDFDRGPSPELSTFYTLLDANLFKSSGGNYAIKYAAGPTLTLDGWVDRWVNDPDDYAAARAQATAFVKGTSAVPAEEIPQEDDEPPMAEVEE